MACGAKWWPRGRWRLYTSLLDREIEVLRCNLVSFECDWTGRVRALWSALTRKYGGTARGSHSSQEGSGWAELLERGCFGFCSTHKDRRDTDDASLFYFFISLVIVWAALASRLHFLTGDPHRKWSVHEGTEWHAALGHGRKSRKGVWNAWLVYFSVTFNRM